MFNINYIGTWTLFKKESWRFLKVYNQTLVAPVINGLLLLAIFKLAVGQRLQTVGEIPFTEFMASGLIMMMVIQQSFANTSSSLIMAKVIGFIIDFLMPPLRAGEMITAMVGAAILRGTLVTIIAITVISFFVDFQIHSYGIIAFYIIFSSLFMGLLGLVTGIYSESFDHVAAITSYIITPLSFLSGTFYSIKSLPQFWENLAHYNPFFHMIDGMRYGMTGYNDGNIEAGMLSLAGLCAVLWVVVHMMLSRGYRIKQ